MSPSLFFLNKIVIKVALKTQFAGKANMKKRDRTEIIAVSELRI